MRLNNILAVVLFCLAGTTSAYTPKYNTSRVYDCIGYLAHEIYCVANSPALYCGILNYCQTENCRSGYVGHEKEKRKCRHSIDSWVKSNYSFDFYRVLENCDGER
ncbi:hypothetical protein PIROE2DRAFT_4418 [Piromyces sp. E2]|nr:hypothetical protein PIROE2DRAFT_4418 [Piromyces sp. E2]|eukprot:OUM67999.1 hypothetical protein PIROE2DRAFT_4418 [Piromyces sp. E2]